MNQPEAEAAMAKYAKNRKEKKILSAGLRDGVFERGDRNPEPAHRLKAIGPAALAQIPQPVIEILLAFGREINNFCPRADRYRRDGRTGDPLELLIDGYEGFWLKFAKCAFEGGFSPRDKR
jgi:hypothetical protein